MRTDLQVAIDLTDYVGVDGYTQEEVDEMLAWLKVNKYDSVEAWARDSDYMDANGEWYRIDDGEWVHDITENLYFAMEADNSEGSK